MGWQYDTSRGRKAEFVVQATVIWERRKRSRKKKSVGGKRFLPCSDCIYFLIEIVKIQSKIYFLQVRELLLTAFPEFLSLKKKKKGKRRC